MLLQNKMLSCLDLPGIILTCSRSTYTFCLGLIPKGFRIHIYSNYDNSNVLYFPDPSSCALTPTLRLLFLYRAWLNYVTVNESTSYWSHISIFGKKQIWETTKRNQHHLRFHTTRTGQELKSWRQMNRNLFFCIYPWKRMLNVIITITSMRQF